MKSISFAALIILVYALSEYGLNLPRNVGLDVPDGKLNSLSFAPYREGQGPLEKQFPSAAEVEADVQLMAGKTHTIRTYASSEGTMPLIPEMARKRGLNMLQGAWLGANKVDNKREIDELIHSANANPDVVKRVIVGNEVLLRGDLKPDELIEYIREVQRNVKQPVSYADVWSEYMKHPQLIKEVDFVTIHILPYWEDEPISVDDAPAHIERIYKQVQQEAYTMVPNIPILIGESGWPSAGRQRGNSVPGVINEAKFIRGLIKVANDNGFDYNIVEAINQSWKNALEGVVGANWGLYSIDREEVFPLTGEVHEQPNWLTHALVAIGLFLFAVALTYKPLQTLSSWQQLGWLVLLQLLMVLIVKQAGFQWYTSYTLWQRMQTIVLLLLNSSLSGLVLQRIYCQFAKLSFKAQWANWTYYLFFTLAALAVFRTLGLAINGRYISFPTVAAYAPVVGLLSLMLVNYVTAVEKSCPVKDINALSGNILVRPQWDKILSSLLVLSSVLLLIGETQAFVVSRDFIKAYPEFWGRLLKAVEFTLSNCQLVTWLLCLAVFVIPFWLSGRRENNDNYD